MAESRRSPESSPEKKSEATLLDLKFALKNLGIKYSEYKEWHELAVQGQQKFTPLKNLYHDQEEHLHSLHSHPTKLIEKIETAIESIEKFVNLDQLLLDANKQYEDLRNFKIVCMRAISTTIQDLNVYEKLIIKKPHLIEDLTLTDLDEYLTALVEIPNLDENGKNAKQLFATYFQKRSESEADFERFKEKYIHLETASLTRDAFEIEGEIDAARNTVKHLPQLTEELEKLNHYLSELTGLISTKERKAAEEKAKEDQLRLEQERQHQEAIAISKAKAHEASPVVDKNKPVVPALNEHKEDKKPSAEKKMDYEACVALVIDVIAHNDRLWKMSKKNFLASPLWKEPSTIADIKQILVKKIDPLEKLKKISDTLLSSEHKKILMAKDKKEKSSATRDLSLNDLVKYKMKPRFQLYIVLHLALQAINTKQPPNPEIIYAKLIEGFNRIETRLGLWKTHLAPFEDIRTPRPR